MTSFKIIAAGLMMCVVAGVAGSQNRNRSFEFDFEYPEAEFQIARVKYRTFGGAGSRGYRQPWWAIDYPMAEEHFLPALRRLTNLSVADDSIHLELTDERIFEYPFLFLQQPGQGNWRPTAEEAARLREHLMRGGFMLVDDLHGEYDWAVLQAALRRVFPERPIVDIPQHDNVMNIFFDLDQRVQIPGARHVRRTYGGDTVTYMEGPPRWRGIYDDRGRLMIAINFNIDMGDAWEHADDPYYPVPMTAQAYKLGVNYVIYAMTH
ncbi:MAG: DUF4159 domain-containing protein [Acidobacteria bacterium]|nr:DUF4159 domain-containing protein [Acidobacteriota bacterium]